MNRAEEYDLLSDVEDDASDLLPKALPVADFPKDFNPNTPPTTAEEYMRLVKYESMKCDKVVTANVDKSMFNNKRTVININRKVPAPKGLAPTKEIIEAYVDQFNCLREKIEQIRLGKIPKPLVPLEKWNDEDKNTFENQDIDLYYSDTEEDHDDDDEDKAEDEEPEAKTEKIWCKFCFGDAFAETLFDDDTPNEMKKYDLSGAKEPLLSIVFNMKSEVHCKLVEWQCEWMKKSGFSTIQSKWLYCLFGCLPVPLKSNTLSCMRNFVVWCSKERLKMVEDNPDLIQLNSLITIVAHGFNQGDLKD